MSHYTERIAILICRMYRPVPSTPCTWFFLSTGQTLVAYLSSFSAVQFFCIVPPNAFIFDVKPLKEIMVLFEIKIPFHQTILQLLTIMCFVVDCWDVHWFFFVVLNTHTHQWVRIHQESAQFSDSWYNYDIIQYILIYCESKVLICTKVHITLIPASNNCLVFPSNYAQLLHVVNYFSH